MHQSIPVSNCLTLASCAKSQGCLLQVSLQAHCVDADRVIHADADSTDGHGLANLVPEVLQLKSLQQTQVLSIPKSPV